MLDSAEPLNVLSTVRTCVFFAQPTQLIWLKQLLLLCEPNLKQVGTTQMNLPDMGNTHTLRLAMCVHGGISKKDAPPIVMFLCVAAAL